MKVYVVMSQYRQDDDGNYNRDIVSVHATQEGAEADPEPVMEWHEHYVIEMDLLEP